MQSYGRFIVGLLRIIAFQRSNIPAPFRTPTYLFIDEFQNFVTDDIEKGLTQLRKYGLHLILAHQYTGQQISYTLQKALYASNVIIAGKNEKHSLLNL
ncbi:MAG: TraM recognition domain-containing protein [Gammaproteobacteria bacterium]|nr:TraM recognition domain-containing protein [Gammaproteobacteria bacterium]